eukprot:scaffold69169_cov66-Phaeocystis_antarctica.AAC.6
MPSSSTSARRAISACRSIQYRSELAPCIHWRKASTQFQLRSKMGRVASLSRWRCSSCTLMRMGTTLHSFDCRTCMTSCDIKHVFPAAGGAVRSRHAAGLAEFRVYSSLTRQTDQDSPISRSLVCRVAARCVCCQQPRRKALNLINLRQVRRGLLSCRAYLGGHKHVAH